MKKNLLNWMTIAMMVLVCVGFTACGSDDDDNGGGGSKSTTVDGKSYGLGYGFWSAAHGNLYLEFSNVDFLNMKSVPNQIDVLALSIETGSNVTGVATGTFDAEASFFSMKYDPNKTTYGAAAEGNVKVTISKNGSNYVVTIPQTTIYAIDLEAGDIEGKIPFSFNYTGSIVYYEDMMEEGVK